MPWKEPDSPEGDPPDFIELVSSIKEKIKNSFKSKNNKNPETNEPVLPAPSCLCKQKNRKYIVELIVKCSECNKVVKHKLITNPYKVAALLVVVSYGASQFIDYAVTDNRYPLDVEHAVMDSCTNSYKRPLARRIYDKKKIVCLCALEDTMNEISYTRYLVDEKGFLSAFEGNAVSCIEQQE